MTKTITIGYEDFRRTIEENCYYVDKTELIQKILGEKFEVLLMTRPRRFGKTLTMSMLENFFDCARDSKELFQGLKISENKELCEAYMNQYPTIFLTLKDIEGLNFDSALKRLGMLITEWIGRHKFLFDSEKIDEQEKILLGELYAQKADYEHTASSLKFLCRIISEFYNSPVILLIDEYDVPLAKASENGYYREMLDLIKAFLGSALKTNPYLKFAVVTGCPRISKESIFIGTNNFLSDDMNDGLFTPYIGFTEAEARQMLKELQLPEEQMTAIKEWYDGYLFGETEMYCPWSVLNHLVRI